MKICGIICEYNPFHKGHQKQINYLKQDLGFDFVVMVMSGNFSQRAIPSIVDKYSKAQMVSGADLIVQIPTAYAINNGEVFAIAGIKLLYGLGVKHICFGVEDNNEELFFELADKMLNETNLYKQCLKEELKDGLSFKTATLNSIKKCYANGEKFFNLLSKPNNILALEYIKAIKRYKYNMMPIFLKREDNFTSLDNQSIASATQIRHFLNIDKPILNFVPISTFNILQERYIKDYMEKFQNIVFNIFLDCSIERLKNTYLVSEGIENKIFNAIVDSNNYNEFIGKITNKRFDQNKINRILLNYILGVDKSIIKNLYEKEFEYCKVIMINTKIIKVLNPRLKLVVRKNDVLKKFEDNKLEKIENKANLIANKIFESSLPYKDIYLKPIIF